VLARQRSRAAGMVDMGVREQNLPERNAVMLGDGEKLIQIAPGVYDGAFHCQVAPDNGAVLLERRDGDRVIPQHGSDATFG
jgi:hypothetical protein